MKATKKAVKIGEKKAILVSLNGEIFIVNSSIKTDLVPEQLVDENGNAVFNEGDNGEKIPAMHFVNKEFEVPFLDRLGIKEEELPDEIQKQLLEIESVDYLLQVKD